MVLSTILRTALSLSRRGRLLTTVSINFLATLTLATLIGSSTHASPVVGFNPGKIIDDGIFINSRTMNTAQIQSFLNSKVPLCDTNGTQTSEYGGGTRAQWAANASLHPNMGAFYPPFTCLKDYTENGLSVAQIIYNLSQQYQLNPQVLIVLLQKEQALVTDTWPSPSQYKTATGYGCPDTAPCDTQYYGLTNQLTWSAKMFKAIMTNSPTWYTPYVLGNNYIQFNPNASCGGTVVNIQNRSTQALYNYTPYQPSQAALDAGWGTVNCGAYGNRNFYSYFTQWFGSTLKPSLPECPTSTFECVWAFRDDSNGQYFYTTDYDEKSFVYQLNYTFIGIVYNARKIDTVGAIPVYRMYGTNGSHIWTTNVNEKDLLVASGYWSYEGIAFYQDPIESNTGYPVHRLYNQTGIGVHILTADSGEISRLISYGYKDEGVVFTTPSTSLPENPAPSGINHIYRILRSNEHFWTTSVNEKDALVASGGRYEGIAWETTTAQDTSVYRLIYPTTGEHFWTANVQERDSLVRVGWKTEGVSWQTKSTGNPTYRLYNTKSGRHLWTTSIEERSIVLSISDWVPEGTAWYQ